MATPDECRKWARAVAEVAGKGAVANPQALVQTLVTLGHLNPYQADVLLRGASQPVLLEGLRITRSLEPELGPLWYAAEGELPKTEEDSGPAVSKSSYWLVAISSEAMVDETFQRWPPSMTWGQRHCNVRHANLDTWRLVGASLRFLYAIGDTIVTPGLSATWKHQGTLGLDAGVRLVREVADALHSMHQAGLVHGRIAMHAIAGDGSGPFLLRRDPLFPPASPYRGSEPSVLKGSEELLATAAPELALPNAQPSVASDLYALGCVWYRSLVGEWPFQPEAGTSAEKWGILHASVPVKIPDGVPPHWARCLLHLLAKSPGVRFPSASAFLKALESGPISVQSVEPVALHAPASQPALPAAKPAAPKKTASEPLGSNAQGRLAADVREKKSKIAKRYHERPFGNESPIPVSSTLDTAPKDTEQKDAPKSSLPVERVARGPQKQAKPKAGKQATKGKKRAKRPVWFLPVMMGGCVLLLLVLLMLLRGQSKGIVEISQGNRRADPIVGPAASVALPSQASSEANRVAIDPLAEYFQIQADDGTSPWAPPSVGSPYSLEMLPMGPEALFFLSEKAWQQQEPLASLAGWWKSLDASDSDAFVPESRWLQSRPISYASVAWYPGNVAGSAQRVVRVTYVEAIKLSEIVAEMSAWKAQSVDASGEGARGTVWVRDSDGESWGLVADGFASQPEALVKRVTLGPQELIAKIVATQGASGPLRRQMESLLQTTDRQADITFLAAPSFLLGDGKEILGRRSPKFLAFLKGLVDDQVQAVLLRTHFTPQWYLEWRTFGNELQAASRQALELKKRLEGLPEWVEGALVTQPADAYWRAIANRYPQMMRTLGRYARVGAEEGHVVFNAYLPSEAITNVIIGSWMAMDRDLTSVASTVQVAQPSVASRTAEQWLDLPISLRIEQDSLENVLQAIANEVKEASGSAAEPLPMAINGTAFQKDGITRNQQIRGFEFQMAPLRNVLTDLARRANPVTTVKSPNEREQKVLWVVVDDPATSTKKKIDLTTRAWSEANKATLPKEFELPKE